MPGSWSQCIVAVDLTVPTVNLYFDGSTTPATTTPESGTLGPLPTGQNAPVLLGGWNTGSGGVTNFYDGVLASVRLWRETVTPVFVPALFNGGFPATYSMLAGGQKTNLVAAWDLSEASGSCADSTIGANTLSEENGPLGQALLCTSLLDRGTRGYHFFCAPLQLLRAMARAFANQQSARAETVRPALDAGECPELLQRLSVGGHHHSRAPTDLSIANFDYSILTADKETYDGNFTYMFPLFYNSMLQLRMRRDAATAINGQIRGTTTYSVGNTYVTNHRGFGAGGVASLAYRVNGLIDPIDLTFSNFSSNTGNVQNQWYAGLDSVDSLILGGLNYDPGFTLEGPYAVQDRFAGYISTVLIYGGTTANGSLTDAQNLAVENWARQLANV